jgi:long-subunit acyl-CoA synthetase (AMP-forming)
MPVLDAFTISGSLAPIMVTDSLGEPYGEVLAGVDVGVTTLGQLQVRGELVSTSALSSSVWYGTNDDAVVENGVISVLGAKNFRKSGVQVRALEAAISTSEFISRAVVLHLSDGSLSIFLQTEPEALSSWARSANLVFTTLSAIVDDAQAQRLLVDEVSQCLQEQSLQNQFDSVIIGRRPLAVATGDLTVTGKVRLGAVATRSGDVRVRLADYRAADPRR